jgi:RimJ/RimL family protein N-acetyltransferase
LLDVASKSIYKSKIEDMYKDTFYDEKYKFFHDDNYRDGRELPDSDWQRRTFVSLDNNGNILGIISYSFNRCADFVSNFGIINFSDNKVVFGRDVAQAFEEIFTKYNHRKITFSVVVGNPIERSYDRLMEKYGGRIVGTYKQHVKLIDNKYYDSKLYEIFREDFMEARIMKGKV